MEQITEKELEKIKIESQFRYDSFDLTRLLSHIESLEEEHKITENALLLSQGELELAFDVMKEKGQEITKLKKALIKIGQISQQRQRHPDDYGELAREALK